MTTLRYLLDTNICIFLRKRRYPPLLERFTRLSPGEAALPAIVYGELIYGAQKRANPAPALRLVEEFCTLVPPLALPSAAGAVYGDIRATLERRGEVIGNNDLWIAAHAVAAGLILVTNNTREFQRVPHLTLENWVPAG